MGSEPRSEPVAQYRYRFGTAEFDEARFELRVDERVVEIQHRPLQVLAELLRYAGEVVTREELREAVWNGRDTVENVIDTALTKIRRALGEANAARIETEPRVGFRLVGPVERLAVGRQFPTNPSLAPGQPVPRRENFRLISRLGASPHHEVWLARHVKTAESRVYKLTADGEGLRALRREAVVSRLIHATLGERADFVRILDWNFDSPPFFLECAYGGEDLVQWASAHLEGASLPERLALCAQVADAIAAAHSVGVLHGDLKPANILVSQTPRGPQVRVTDFGSARLFEPDRLAGLGITQLGLTGADGLPTDPGDATPLYAAPERLAGGMATVESDVYVLGTLLYQLVIGDLRKPLVPGWERDVPEELLCGDIAAATDGEPAVRLASAAQLAHRLRHFDSRRNERERQRAMEHLAQLDREALRRARVRRPWLIATVSVLCVGLAGVLLLYGEVRSTQSSLSQQYAVSTALNSFLTNDFIAVANPSLSGRKDVTVVDAARAAAASIDTAFKGADPDVRGGLHAAMQGAFSGLSDFPASIAEGQKALAAFTAARPPDPGRIAQVRIRLALTLAQSSKLQDAAAELDAAASILAAAHLHDPALEARYWWARASVAGYGLNLARAPGLYQRAWSLAQRAPDLPLNVRNQMEFSYADSLRMSGDFPAAARQANDLFVRERMSLGATHPQTCYAAVLLASILGYLDRETEGIARVKQASACLLETLGPANIRTASAYQVMADLQFQSQRWADAATSYRKVAQVYSAILGPQALRTISARMNVGVAEQYAGNDAQAEPSLAATLSLSQNALGPSHPMTEVLRYHLADCRLDERKTAGVGELLNGLSPVVLSEGQIEPDWDGRLAYEQGRLALFAGESQRAIALLETAADVIGKKNPTGRVSVRAIQRLLQAARSTHSPAAASIR